MLYLPFKMKTKGTTVEASLQRPSHAEEGRPTQPEDGRGVRRDGTEEQRFGVGAKVRYRSRGSA